MALKKRLRGVVRICFDVVQLFCGIICYLLQRNKPLNQRTPSWAHLSMIRLFCVTRGYSNDIANKIISLLDKKLILSHYNGILGNFSESDLDAITSQLDKEGYYIFEKKLSDELIQKFYHFALNQECNLRPLDNEKEFVIKKAFFDKNNPKVAVYDLPLSAFLADPDYQSLLKDHSILSVAQSYLRASPKIDHCAAWWTAAFSEKAESNAAQMFHFDMDRFKWLKFFIFITDVTLESGPHVFIKASHRSGAIPPSLLAAGYSRHSDETVMKHYLPTNVKTFTVPAGTIIAEDTRGLHKGTLAIKGERLVIELQFSNSLFGATTPAIFSSQIESKEFLEFAKEYRKVFKLIVS